MKKKSALLLIDLQNDFCHRGKLEVADGDAVIPIANQLQPYFNLVVATKDWHPKDHASFASNHAGHAIGERIHINGISQILWPDHCVQGTQGSEFHPLLDTKSITKIIYKGTDKLIDSYSAFFDNQHLRVTGLDDYLKKQGVQQIYMMGLATDYCVKYSCFDALQLGFAVFVIEDGCRGVGLKPGDVAQAFNEMRDKGAEVIQSSLLQNALNN